VEQHSPAARWRAALATASAGYAPAPPRPLGSGDPGVVGPYRIEAVLGQGGMGRVFLARDIRDERAGPVAVKVLARTEDATAWSRFRRELQAARRVHGDGTARVLDGDAEADPPWLAAEYIAGPTLERLVSARGPVDPAAAAGLAVGVAGALGEIHAAGVVHRDLKPANIILGADGPRVVDFGIARTGDATTLSVTGWAMGTPGYMAPEQITDPDAVGPQADVFALGSVLVYATTGSSPYQGGDPAAVIYRIVHDQPRLSGVPASLRPLVEACLTRDPAARPSVEAVAAAALRIVDYEAARSAALAEETVEPLASTAPPRPAPEPPPLEMLSAPAPSTGARESAFAARTTAERLPVQRRLPVDGGGPADGGGWADCGGSPDRGGWADRAGSPARAGSGDRRFGRVPLALLAALGVAALAATGWFAATALAHPSSAGTNAAPRSPGARAAGHDLFAGGTVVLGPQCATTQWGVFSVTSPTLERNVGGGDPACHGQADAFRKSGAAADPASPAAPVSRAVWRFAFPQAVRCTLAVYIAQADPSSGRAVYEVTAHGTTTTFGIQQSAAKGGFTTPPALRGLSAPDGDIVLVLTDLTAKPGDTNHVTASSVAATCQPS
jgi:hypothetical protein